ncbi:MAG TPA: hypothetical protein VG916_12865, partial [Gemmatimonadaceae bacterium]|nr:hypothetical protein [Gemmatimonadaceae bacterium]
AVYFGVGKFTDDSSDIRRVSVTGGAPTLIERVRARDGEMTPDGTEFWGVSGKFPDLTLVHIPLGSHQVHHVMREPGPVMNPAIGRDGRIAVARVDSTRDMQVWLFDNGTLHQLTHFAANDGRPQWPSWSPDGTVLAVQAGVYDRNHPESNTAHIWLVDAATGTARKLAAHDAPYLDETPSFFPDGRRIAFQSNRTGRMEVWVMNVDGSGARQITR